MLSAFGELGSLGIVLVEVFDLFDPKLKVEAEYHLAHEHNVSPEKKVPLSQITMPFEYSFMGKRHLLDELERTF